ncbi:pepsin-like aspartic protease [Vibrio vulnificus]|uniref:pepsin-like aspartic protease n=1 Tax=Vibrio vulnificus TaxID=672 RepID=UPI001F04FC36|nr:pepsin-like aspartic protease [Vibrio vulnificus]MCG9652880.1 A1 family peptidase [Vibrio vulnificus]
METEVKKIDFRLVSGITMGLQKGPFQNNGASPWYAILGVGETNQRLKFSFDTGSNFNWVTSTYCPDSSCHHYGNQRFNPNKSSTYVPITEGSKPVDFGPWGEMQVVSGNDNLTLSSKTCLNTDLYLSTQYEGVQFLELDWDGGIGLPTLTYQPLSTDLDKVNYRGMHCQSREASFHFMETLIAQNVVSKDHPYVAFTTNSETKKGQVTFGALDPSYGDSREYMFLPWERYNIESLYYIWTTSLEEISLAGEVICRGTDDEPQWFCLDSGSSQFKGDPANMKHAQTLAKSLKGDLTLTIPENEVTKGGELVVPSSLYDVLIEEGSSKGEHVVQFEPMEGLDRLTLVGSVLMDSLYTVYQYQVRENGTLYPVGMWIFNKIDGPKIINVEQDKAASIFLPRYESQSDFTGRWVNSYGSQMDLTCNDKGELFGSYSSTTGASGRYLVYGSTTTEKHEGKGSPLVLSITWLPCDQTVGNESWHWVSTYCGQLNANNSNQMSVINSLVATCSYEGSERGDFIDRLGFEKISGYVPLEQHQHLGEVFNGNYPIQENDINGHWYSELSKISISITLKDSQTGLSFALFKQGDDSCRMKGFVDVYDASAPHHQRQSITLSGCLCGTPISISGYRDRNKDKLVLSYWRALAQPESESYMQANAQPLICSRMK